MKTIKLRLTIAAQRLVMLRNFFLILCCLFHFQKFYSNNILQGETNIVLDKMLIKISDSNLDSFSEKFKIDLSRPSPLFKLFHLKDKKNKKLMAALLAFPLPFGIVGLHRIYLGCAPYVPVVYIATFGGVLGLLPLIDFCFILLDKNIESFTNNKKVFMWVK